MLVENRCSRATPCRLRLNNGARMATDLNLLAIFSAVAEAGNFSAAAERLGLTRSAVSQGIRRLEADIGHPLFLRTTRSVRLTEQGTAMRARVSRALQE